MHIVYVCREYPPSLRGGGIASYIKEIAHGMCQAGHKVTVVCASDDTRREYEEMDEGVRIIRCCGGDFLVPSVESVSFIKRFRPFYRFHSYRKRIKEIVATIKNIDVIEVADYGAEAYHLLKMDIPVVIRLHCPSVLDIPTLGLVKRRGINILFNWLDEKEISILKNSPYLSSCSEALKRWCVSNLSINANVISVVNNPFGMDVSDRSTVVFNSRRIVNVGTYTQTKGCGELLEAVRILNENNNDKPYELYFYGKSGIYGKWLKSQEAVYPWLHVMGKVDRSEVLDIYRSAQVVCFPSWWENMPMVCIEAMAVGSIVVGSSIGGMSEIIEDGVSGFLEAPKNPEALAIKLSKALHLTQQERENMSNAAKKRICTHFSTKVIVEKMQDYYCNVIKDFNQ